MPLYAVNVRAQFLSADGNALAIAKQNLRRALILQDQRVFLYRPWGEPDPGYYAQAIIARVEPNEHNRERIWIEFADITPLAQIVTVAQLHEHSDGTRDPPFAYAPSIRRVHNYEAKQLLELEPQAYPEFYEEAAGEERLAPFRPPSRQSRMVLLRSRVLRTEMFRLHGSRCAFTGLVGWCLNHRIPSTQVGHIVALEYGGPDVIQNVLPMSQETNWHWDAGVISLTNDGRIMIAARAAPESRKLFEEGRRVRFADARDGPRSEYIEWHRDVIFEKGRQPGLRWNRP